MNALEKRMFYLMLSVQEGQFYAQSMGFPPPSEEVQEIEQTDVMTRWGIFIATDIYNEIVEATEWFTDFMDHFDKLGSSVEEFREVMTVFGVALTNKLIDSERVIPMLDNLFTEEDDDE